MGRITDYIVFQKTVSAAKQVYAYISNIGYFIMRYVCIDNLLKTNTIMRIFYPITFYCQVFYNTY